MAARVARTVRAAVATLMTATVLSGCATNGLGDLPLPAPGIGSGGYRLTALFSNVLNLPDSAKVKLAGADVGQVDEMHVRNFTAVTTLRILDGVRLPKGSTAELRSATPLGDVFVSIRPPVGASADGPLLADGDTIGLDSTTAAATVESVLSSAALASLGTGSTGRRFNELVKQAGDIVEANRDHLKQTILNSNTALKAVVDNQREISEWIDVQPLAWDNMYNAVDHDNKRLRVRFMTDRLVFESQMDKEICNMMGLRQLGCSTGTLQDYGPDFGLTYVLDGLAAMGQK
ncbi:Putative Mce family protein [Mycobacteroides abscessus subsp. abscessus]|nr:Putative Mce family protein [Mycobacteroides abscessus subsp. abscessus]